MGAFPYALAVSPLDCESLNVMFGFDYTYRGNHNRLVAEAQGLAPALERFAESLGRKCPVLSRRSKLHWIPNAACSAASSFETRTSTLAFGAR